MKLPYIKLYTADLLAASRNLTAEQVGAGIMSICELAFENDTAYDPQTAREITFFEMLTRWKEESKKTYKKNKEVSKKAAQIRWQKNKVSEGAPGSMPLYATPSCQPETETETEPETEPNTETENINTPMPPAAQGESTGLENGSKKDSRLLAFANQVLTHYEAHAKTDVQKSIWLRKNRRHLRDILNFCGTGITLALRTIRVCILHLKQGGGTKGRGLSFRTAVI